MSLNTLNNAKEQEGGLWVLLVSWDFPDHVSQSVHQLLQKEGLNSKLQVILKIFSQELKDDVQEIQEISWGIIHQVCRIVTKNKKIYYAKIRHDYFYNARDISCNPSDIEYEEQALTFLKPLFSSIRIFPTIVFFDKSENILILEDVMGDQWNLEENYNNGRNIWMNDMKKIGEQLRDIYEKLAQYSWNYKRKNNEKVYTDNLKYRLQTIQSPVTERVITFLENTKTQIILGDLSPKNISISPTADISICDLESMHIGNKIMDVGFFVAHIVLHQIHLPNLWEKIHALINWIFSEDDNLDEDHLVYIISLILLYRLGWGKIPYNLHLTMSQKKYLRELVEKRIYENENSEKIPSLISFIQGLSWDFLTFYFNNPNQMTKNSPWASIVNDELELKILEVDKDQIIQKLEALGWVRILDDITQIETVDFLKNESFIIAEDKALPRFIPIIQKINEITQWKATLFENWAYLRIRKEGEKSEVILKYKMETELNAKLEKEISFNFEYSEWEELSAYLKSIGLRDNFFQEKQRVSYVLENLDIRVDIDTWPKIPTYIEIEWHSFENIYKVVQLLWYTEADTSSEWAWKIFKKYGISPFNLRFNK